MKWFSGAKHNRTVGTGVGGIDGELEAGVPLGDDRALGRARRAGRMDKQRDPVRVLRRRGGVVGRAGAAGDEIGNGAQLRCRPAAREFTRGGRPLFAVVVDAPVVVERRRACGPTGAGRPIPLRRQDRRRSRRSPPARCRRRCARGRGRSSEVCNGTATAPGANARQVDGHVVGAGEPEKADELPRRDTRRVAAASAAATAAARVRVRRR